MRDYPTFGPVPTGDGRTRFRFWAPAQAAVHLAIEGRSPLPMQAEDDGWFAVTAECGPGTRYRFRLEDGTEVPDPASRCQPDDVFGPSMVVDPGSYRWRTPDWQGRPWRETVLYELHAGTCGGYAGVRAMLPGLAELGVTAVELMPVNEFPGRRNWGYDGVLPYAPDAAYGSPDDLKALVDDAHGHGLSIFLDVVYNHFGPDGNFLALYAPQFFHRDGSTAWGEALDFRQPAVRRFFAENALWWLDEYRFDGLRFDAVQAIGEASWLDETAAFIRRSLPAGRHVHLVLEHDENMASHLRNGFDAQWNDDGHHVLHTLLTGEGQGYYRDYADGAAERLARCLAEGFVYQGEASRHRGGKPRGSPSADLPPTAFVLFLQNHDQIGNRAFGDRLTTLADPDALEAAIALQLLVPQIPLLFMGEEDASQTPFLYFTDHRSPLDAAVREGRRREFAAFPDFADPDKRALIPDPNAQETFRASVSQPDAARGEDRRALYRCLLAIRAREIAPRLDGAASLGATAVGAAAAHAAWRLGDGSRLTVAVNLGPDAVSIPAPEGRALYLAPAAPPEAVAAGTLPGRCTVAFLADPA